MVGSTAGTSCLAVETGDEWETRQSKRRVPDTCRSKDRTSAYTDCGRERDTPVLYRISLTCVYNVLSMSFFFMHVTNQQVCGYVICT